MSGALFVVFNWGQQSFGLHVPSEIMRLISPAVTLISVGIQLVFGALLLGFIEIEGLALSADIHDR